jgi:hypothetical protein
VEVGVHFFNQTLSGEPGALRKHLRDTAEAAEDAGCTMFTCMDHYFQMEAFTRAEDPMLEGYTSLGYVAEVRFSWRRVGTVRATSRFFWLTHVGRPPAQRLPPQA